MPSQWKTIFDNISATVYSNNSRAVTAQSVQNLIKSIWINKDNYIYVTDKPYAVGSVCLYDDGSGFKIYRCVSPTSGAFNPSAWAVVSTTSFFSLSELQINNLTTSDIFYWDGTNIKNTPLKTINGNSIIGSGNISISSSPAGSDGQIQWNNSGAFGASRNLYWDKINNRLSVGMGSSPAARVDIRAQGALSSDIGLRVRDSANTHDLMAVRGNGTIDFLPLINNPIINVRSNINPTVNFIDSNGIGAVIAHRYQFNPSNGSNLISQSLNFAAYGVGGGSLGVAKINNFINPVNWSNATPAQREGGWHLYFKYTNNFETITDADRAMWVTPDRRVFIYNQVGSVITTQTDAFHFYSDDITPGNAAPHFITEAGDLIRLFSSTGWELPSGIYDRSTFDPSSVTLEELARRVAALISDLYAGGIGLLKN